MIGRTLGHYRILEKIGAGGMGEVYRAEDLHLSRDVAVKVLPAGTLVDEHARQRFRKEAEALSKLNHPNIQTVHDFDTQEKVDFLVVELVPGPTLAEKLGAGALPEKEIASLGSQIAAALEEAHERGVVHRDLKPGNIKVTPKGQVKVLDFGLAKLLKPFGETATTEGFTETHTAAGTVPYMAPEQLRGEAVDARTDIWALGAVLYEMATARRPFEAKLATALAADIQTKAVMRPTQVNAKISLRLEEIIVKCLEKEPENRYQSAKELAVDLRRLAAPALTPAPSARASSWGRTLERVVAPAGVVIALLALLVGLNVGGLRERLSRSLATSPPGIQSLAVLPLKNLMGDPEQDYFVEGMHEALITELSKISGLKVISRTSAMRYKDSEKSLPEIARELNVDAVVEGSVLRAGGRVRVTAQLIQAASDRHLWAENYDRELHDILALHSDVARAVAREVQVALTPAEKTRLAEARPVDPEAYEAYLKGRYHLNKFTRDEIEKAIAYFQGALTKDPGYAAAYSGLADCYNQLGTVFIGRPPADLRPKAIEAASRALAVDEGLAEAHASLGWAKFFGWDWSGAERELQRAISLSPNYAEARRVYSLYLMSRGRFDEAVAEGRKAVELDPLSATLQARLGQVLFYARRYDDAVREFGKALDLDPNFVFALWHLGDTYVQMSRFEEAIAALEKAATLSSRSPAVLGYLACAHERMGQGPEARKLLRELTELSRVRYVSPNTFAWLYSCLGDKERAFEYLEKAFEERSYLIAYIAVYPGADPLRDDPRFQDLLRRMKLPQ